jgi:5-methyltetrahydropteroyltriglutamate--homocysteine methyltransferase
MATPFRADHVGSLLRPAELLQARNDFTAGIVSAEKLREVEDAATLRALDMQKQAGIDIFSSGEYRRAGWATAIRESVEGLVANTDTSAPANRLLGQWQGPNGVMASAVTLPGGSLVAGEKLRLKKRFAGEEAAFLKQHAPGPWKITMPGAYSAAGQLFKDGISDSVYASRKELAYDIVEMLKSEIDALINDGCSYIQRDSLHYVERVADRTIRQRMIEDGEDPDAYLDEIIAADNAVLDHARGRGVTVGLHMCRGNNRSAWHAEGSYEPVAERAFNQLNVDRFLLEYDTARAGGFEPLRFMPKDKTVVLGLVSSKEPELESVDALRRRIEEAAQYVPLENLALSPQCGFASTMLGNLLTWEEQAAKLARVAETARAVWGDS